MNRLQNVGTTDRMTRILLGLLLLSSSFFLQSPLSVILLAVGIVAVITGVTGFCALYLLFGFGKHPRH